MSRPSFYIKITLADWEALQNFLEIGIVDTMSPESRVSSLRDSAYFSDYKQVQRMEKPVEKQIADFKAKKDTR